MRSRLHPIVACVITLAMVAFGQVCAVNTLVRCAEPSVVEAADHEATCDPRECGGEGPDEAPACPTGAASCCSTWGPPISRLVMGPPTPTVSAPLDGWLAPSVADGVETGAAEVAPDGLARPPGGSTTTLLAASLSRRGPPAVF